MDYMLNSEKTLEKFGYLPESLSVGSHKTVIVTCDYCGCDIERPYKAQNAQRNRFKLIGFFKDSCKPCGQLKSREAAEIGGTWDDRQNRMKESLKKTMLENYGVDHPSKLESVKQKLKKTWANKTEEEIKERTEKSKKTVREKYGVDHVSQSREVRDKTEKTWIEKYGVDNPSRADIVKKKRANTIMERFGAVNAGQNDEIKAKIAATNLKRYGGLFMNIPDVKAEYIAKFKENKHRIREKTVKTCLERYGTTAPLKNKIVLDGYMEKLIESGKFRLIDGKTIKDFCAEKGLSISYANQLIRQGFDVRDYQKNFTRVETVTKGILEKNGLSFSSNKNIESRKYDFLIGNLVIECDGLYWHSDVNKEKRYHQIKRNFYLENGYKPLFFRENEILNYPEIVESIILNKLNKSNRIFARKCYIVEGNAKDARDWFNTNHLMGAGRGRVFFLVEKNTNEKVCAIQLSNKKEGELYEVSRFAPKLNTSVIGGFSKLINHAHNIINFKQLFTYIDLRYGSGSYLKDLGFNYAGEYVSFCWTDFENVFHRMRFRGDSGYELGMAKLWDCGQAKYVRDF
jgi:very-short-patch-repair endonuclease